MRNVVFAVIAMLFGSQAFGQSFNGGQFLDGADVFPENWKIIGKATGDLNNDKREDVAYVVSDTDEKKYYYNPTAQDPKRDVLNVNPRFLVVMFKNSDGRFLYDNRFKMRVLSERDSMDQCLLDPFRPADFKIANGLLYFGVEYVYKCLGWHTTKLDHVFKFRKDDFELISIEKSVTDISNGKKAFASYDFIKRKVRITEPESQAVTKKLKLKRPIRMTDFRFDTEYEYK